ncbi:hypothetical protein AB0M48_05750 [Lentzea sp. NPDC051208]|uniref:hypothetical protein n=1 Tax=Lentzea sp. NPDC051208 TaxID=3154642 RepID=UPI00343A216E
MTETTHDYLTRFASVARGNGVPADVIGDKVAEIEAHVADSGEHPRDAFGDPVQYAATLQDQKWLPAVEIGAFVAADLGLLGVAQGVLALRGSPFPLGPAVLSAVAGGALAALLFSWLTRAGSARQLWPVIGLVASMALFQIVEPWRHIGVQPPGWASLAVGAVLATGALAFLVHRQTPGGAVTEPTGRNRDDLLAHQPGNRVLLAVILVVATIASGLVLILA